MPKFGKRSLDNLNTCHPDLQKLFKKVVEYYDCSIICGHRSKDDQDAAYHDGRSKVQWPYGKHNSLPSMAVDVVPYFKNEPHIRWDDRESFYFFAGSVFAIAAELGIKVRWGGNWDSDDEFHDQSFFDLPHFELVE